MKSFTMCWLFLALVLSTTGCRSLFPTESKTSRTPWQNYEEAQAAFDKITPHQTSLEDLKSLGFDPVSTPNVKVLTYLDLIERFIPNQSITLKDLQPDVRACIEAKDTCHAYELELDISRSKRYGNLALDMFGFKKNTRVTGWSFKALIIMKDDRVAYKIRSGQPNIERYEKKLRPLGPFQELENLVTKVPGML